MKIIAWLSFYETQYIAACSLVVESPRLLIMTSTQLMSLSVSGTLGEHSLVCYVLILETLDPKFQHQGSYFDQETYILLLTKI